MNCFAPLSIARVPRVEFCVGSIRKLTEIAAASGKRLLPVIGARRFVDSASATSLFLECEGSRQSNESNDPGLHHLRPVPVLQPIFLS